MSSKNLIFVIVVLGFHRSVDIVIAMLIAEFNSPWDISNSPAFGCIELSILGMKKAPITVSVLPASSVICA